MKHRAVLTGSCVGLLTATLAQSWCPPGAEWHYEFSNASSAAGYERVTYIGDTLIEGATCQKLARVMHAVDQATGTAMTMDHPRLYTRYADEVVSIQVQDTFDTLWYYGAVPGDAWRVPIPDWTTPPLITVMDTGLIMVDAVPLRWWSIEVSDQPWGETLVDTIIERIGALRIFMLPEASYFIEDHSGPLRCYADDGLQYMHAGVEDCDMLLSLHELDSPSSARFFPQPSSAILTLTCHGGIQHAELVVWDHSGREVARRPGLQDASVVDLSDLPPGAYGFGLLSKGRTSRGRIIIAR